MSALRHWLHTSCWLWPGTYWQDDGVEVATLDPSQRSVVVSVCSHCRHTWIRVYKP